MSLSLNDFYWDGFFWKSSITFGTIHSRREREGSADAADPASRLATEIDIVFAPEGRDESPLTAEELALANWFVNHQESVFETVLASIFRCYPNMQAEYGYSEIEPAEYMPDVESVSELCKLIELRSVNVHPIRHGDVPYLGGEFSCQRDQEHGLGVL
ncbi:MAG: hypothetical protein AAF907_11365, partial [Planctomycetota bacterium]